LITYASSQEKTALDHLSGEFCDVVCVATCACSVVCRQALQSNRRSQLCEVSHALSTAGAAKAKESAAAHVGPRKALAKLQLDRMSIAENKAWLEAARIEAVLGSCRRSMPSVRYVVGSCI